MPYSSDSSSRSSQGRPRRQFSLRRLFKKASLESAPPSPPNEREAPAPAPQDQLATINSSSPASEIPSTWPEWERAYAAGLIDFNDPPPPPSSLSTSSSRTFAGLFRAPAPLNEHRRQRAIDSLNTSRGRRRTRRSPSSERRKESPQDLSSFSSSQASSSPSVASTSSDDLAGRPGFHKLAVDARRIFQIDNGFAGVTFLDKDECIFLGEEGSGIMPGAWVPRETTVCNHALLQGTTGQDDGMVVLDMSKDWRFTQNHLAAYAHGFYAGFPVPTPAPFGDHSADSYLAGVMFIIDKAPRTNFSAEDRARLRELARQAAVEITRWKEEQKILRTKALEKKRVEWRGTVDAVVVVDDPAKGGSNFGEPPLTPPELPEATEFEHGESDVDYSRAPVGSETQSTFERPWRPVAESYAVTSSPPTVHQRDGNHGILAASMDVPPILQSLFDLATQLLAESLDLEFSFLVAVDLPSSPHSSRTPLRLISAHNFPKPPPFFDLELLQATLASGAIIYSDPDWDGEEGEYTTGVLIEVSLDREGRIVYVLGAFSDDPKRVLERADLLFVQSFAADLARHTSSLS